MRFVQTDSFDLAFPHAYEMLDRVFRDALHLLTNSTHLLTAADFHALPLHERIAWVLLELLLRSCMFFIVRFDLGDLRRAFRVEEIYFHLDLFPFEEIMEFISNHSSISDLRKRAPPNLQVPPFSFFYLHFEALSLEHTTILVSSFFLAR